jgi:hypothetical protein
MSPCAICSKKPRASPAPGRSPFDSYSSSAACASAIASLARPMAERDFLDKMIAKRTARNPEFPQLLDAARRRRELLRTLAREREQQQRTQTGIAAAMETSQSFVARLESTAADAKISTVDRYAETLGYVVQYHLIPAEDGADQPAVVVHK